MDVVCGPPRQTHREFSRIPIAVEETRAVVKPENGMFPLDAKTSPFRISAAILILISFVRQPPSGSWFAESLAITPSPTLSMFANAHVNTPHELPSTYEAKHPPTANDDVLASVETLPLRNGARHNFMYRIRGI